MMKGKDILLTSIEQEGFMFLKGLTENHCRNLLMDLYTPRRRIWQVVFQVAGDLLP